VRLRPTKRTKKNNHQSSSSDDPEPSSDLPLSSDNDASAEYLPKRASKSTLKRKRGDPRVQPQPRHEQGEGLEEPSLNMKSRPKPAQLRRFEIIPILALLALWLNSGLDYQRPTLTEDDVNSLQNDPSFWSDSINDLVHDIGDPVSDEILAGCVRDFEARQDYSQPILTCAACGVRRLTRLTGEHFTCHNVTALNVLRLTEEQRNSYLATSPATRDLRSVYTSINDHQQYHLHRQFVSADANNTETVRLCRKCHTAVTAPKPIPPPNSIAAGCDFGCAERIGLPPLSDLERIAIGRFRLYATTIQLAAPRGDTCHDALTGHIIVFRVKRFCIVSYHTALHGTQELHSHKPTFRMAHSQHFMPHCGMPTCKSKRITTPQANRVRVRVMSVYC
jgi:hypothetical protein